MTTSLRPETSRAGNQLGLPPPGVRLDLRDAGRVVGWVRGDVIGFRGFTSEREAVSAAAIASRALARRNARRAARRDGTRPILVGAEPLALQRRGDEETILVGGREVGTLVRPGAAAPGAADLFGFTIRIPPPVHELTARAKAHVIYRELRRAGVRFETGRPDGEAPTRADRAAPIAHGRSR